MSDFKNILLPKIPHLCLDAPPHFLEKEFVLVFWQVESNAECTLSAVYAMNLVFDLLNFISAFFIYKIAN
jgi:hypothetical protein